MVQHVLLSSKCKTVQLQLKRQKTIQRYYLS